ncbi:MAG: hypothetical protein ACYC2O_06830 [Microthrixaceae bacterium]
MRSILHRRAERRRRRRIHDTVELDMERFEASRQALGRAVTRAVCPAA